MYNHSVPSSWLEVMASMKDFMDAPEAAIEYYHSTPPRTDERCAGAQALNMAWTRKQSQNGVM